jgi:hypothetical protein
MKTAMQELIEYLRSLAFSKCHLGMGDIMLTQGHIDELEEKYIEKEKEQIMRAFNYGYYCASNGTIDELELGEKQYYNQTYNKNK